MPYKPFKVEPTAYATYENFKTALLRCSTSMLQAKDFLQNTFTKAPSKIQAKFRSQYEETLAEDIADYDLTMHDVSIDRVLPQFVEKTDGYSCYWSYWINKDVIDALGGEGVACLSKFDLETMVDNYVDYIVAHERAYFREVMKLPKPRKKDIPIPEKVVLKLKKAYLLFVEVVRRYIEADHTWIPCIAIDEVVWVAPKTEALHVRCSLSELAMTFVLSKTEYALLAIALNSMPLWLLGFGIDLNNTDRKLALKNMYPAMQAKVYWRRKLAIEAQEAKKAEKLKDSFPTSKKAERIKENARNPKKAAKALALLAIVERGEPKCPKDS